MDRKSVIILFVCFILLFLWFPLVNRLFPPTPLPIGTNEVATATNAIGATNLPPQLRTAHTVAPDLPPAPTPVEIEPGAPEETLTIENQDARYTFSSLGGGLKKIELIEFPATVVCGRDKVASTNRATLNAPAPVPALTILADGVLRPESGFNLENTAGGVRAEKLLSNGLRLSKDYQLGTNFLIKATVRLQNQSTQAVAIPTQEWVIGTATPVGRRDETLMMGIQWYNGKSAESVDDRYFQNRTLGCFPGTPRSLYSSGAGDVIWAGVHNQFFALVAVPSQPAPRVLGRRIDLPPPTPEELAADPDAMSRPIGYQAAFLYPNTVLQPGEILEKQFDIYAGPKEYNTLSRLPNNLDLVMKFGFFGWVAKLLLLAMNGLHHLVGLSYGIAIVVITVIIKVLFWPLTNASTKSMKRMAALQPQMKAIQEKYKEDPKKMNMKLMEFMKENRVSPLGGCLPMLLQIPVFIGFYTMLQSAIELRGAQFLWACDLSRADTIWTIPGINFPLNPMPLLMGVTMLWQARMTPPSPGMDPVQQKIMRYMPLMFMVFLYNFSAGLTLYWTVQNLLTIAQMKLTKSTDPKTAGGVQPASPAARNQAPRKKKP